MQGLSWRGEKTGPLHEAMCLREIQNCLPKEWQALNPWLLLLALRSGRERKIPSQPPLLLARKESRLKKTEVALLRGGSAVILLGAINLRGDSNRINLKPVEVLITKEIVRSGR